MPGKIDLTYAIISTLCYADIFDYPLTKIEIFSWLIGNHHVTTKQVAEALMSIPQIKHMYKYYFLKDKKKIIQLRLQRQKYAKEKLAIAIKSVAVLKHIPFIKLIGITGALSMNNTKKYDDIDLFIITKTNRLWTTRFFATLLIELTGQRRRPNQTIADDKICMNMFVAEDHLTLPQNEQDLFSAHEVLQMKPLYDKNGTYQKFIEENHWTKKYLPNAYEQLTWKFKTKDTSAVVLSQVEGTPLRWRNLHGGNMCISLLNILENIFKNLQLWYMQSHRTKEIIADGSLRFHPQDARVWITKEFNQRLFLHKISLSK